MSILFYISHPQVQIDPAIPVPKWGLSDIGRKRAIVAARSSTIRNVKSIFTSDETKAIETAEILAAALHLSVNIRKGLHENDRSATGFVPPDEFEKLADAFFASPQESIKGWERAIDAQTRIVSAIQKVLEEAPEGDIIVTGHGGVGTLLYCHFSDAAISRTNDQPAGGGNFFAIDRETKTSVHGWKKMEQI